MSTRMSTHLELPRTDDVRFPARYLLHPLRPVARFLVRRRYSVHLHALEAAPKTGPVIFAANHTGLIDGPLLAMFAPRPVHALTKQEMFEGKLGPVLRGAGQIKLDRFHADPFAVKQSVRVLRDGAAVGVFPEGTRGSGELHHAHRGAAYLAMVTGAPIVPVMMIGTREPGAKSSSLPAKGTRIDIAFGVPHRIAQTPWPRTREAVAEETELLRQRMVKDLQSLTNFTGRTLPGPLPAGDKEVAVERDIDKDTA